MTAITVNPRTVALLLLLAMVSHAWAPRSRQLTRSATPLLWQSSSSNSDSGDISKSDDGDGTAPATNASNKITSQKVDAVSGTDIPPRHPSTPSPEDDIAHWQQRARDALAKSKAKLEQRMDPNSPASDDSPPPFFASREATPARRDLVIKAVDDTTGLITADGEKLAALSETEAWEMRSLRDVFEEDTNETLGARDVLATKDVAMQIFNLRKQLQNEDYARIFDKRNHFIGEDT